ncbi:MAG TPA: universal stress protein [Micromonosporaceae bacterium]|jgi:nucleotide-binding universal stress UspA family protein
MENMRRIIVGIDGSEGGRRALQWAVREAASRGGTVQAVIAWRWDGIEGRPVIATSPSQQRAWATQTLAHEIESVPEHHRAGVTIASEAVEGRPGDVLTSVAADADLLVLGSHGHSRVWHTVLGSVSEECVRKATCPVLVVPVPREAPHAAAEPALRA